MNNPKIDFLRPSQRNDGQTSQTNVPHANKIWRNIFLIAILTIAACTGFIAMRRSGTENIDRSKKTFSFLGSMRSLISSGDKQLKGEHEGRINVALLGIGGAGHEGPNLTDTIILASIEPKTKRVAMLSIPRDMFVPIPGYGYRRINNANAFAEEALPGTGGIMMKEVLGDLLDMDVHYYVRVDFEGFRKLVDDLGGVIIDVEKNFSDPLFPTENFKNRTVTFNEGPQLMDGERALEYARSRHGTNGEGSDFARARRQQKLLLGIRDKVLSLGVLANPAKLFRAWQTVSEHVSTDMEAWELARLANLLKDVEPNTIVRRTLETAPEGPLVARMIDGAFALLPESGTWDEVRGIAKNIFTMAPEVKKKTMPTVEIQNGTVVPGFAASTAELLNRSGFKVVKIGNAKLRDYEKSIIYEVKDPEHKEDLAKLKEILNAQISGALLDGVPTLPATTSGTNELGSFVPNVNFLIILGTQSLAVIK